MHIPYENLPRCSNYCEKYIEEIIRKSSFYKICMLADWMDKSLSQYLNALVCGQCTHVGPCTCYQHMTLTVYDVIYDIYMIHQNA